MEGMSCSTEKSCSDVLKQGYDDYKLFVYSPYDPADGYELKIPPSNYLQSYDNDTKCRALITQSFTSHWILGQPVFFSYVITLDYLTNTFTFLSKDEAEDYSVAAADMVYDLTPGC